MNHLEVEGHSERLFTDSRDHWYNRDFLDLMAGRWGLSRHRTLLDLGAGLCHWSRLLLPYLQAGAEVTATDFDPKWAEGSPALEQYFLGKGAAINFVRADAHQLPFADSSFDVVTCQTLLIHLHDPERALGEMKRVVKPQGIVICAEPNNRVQHILQDSVSRNDDVETATERFKAGLATEKEKLADNEGDHSFGDLLTGTMSRLGFRNIRAYLNDKLMPLFPPYSSAEQQAVINNYLDWERNGDLYDLEKKHLTELNRSDFPAFLEAYGSRHGHDRILDALKNRTYHNGGASLIYLVSGTK